MRAKPYNPTPLMDLGSWVRSQASNGVSRGSIAGCPWSILDAAYRHLALRIRAVEVRVPNHQARSTLRWLRRWQRIAESELTDQRDRARAALRLSGPARQRGSMNGLTHAYRDCHDGRFVCGVVADAKLKVPPGSVVTCMWCLPRVCRMATWGKEDSRV